MIALTPWAEEDLPLLMSLNAPEMTAHLGGPESEEQVLRRHRHYVDDAALPVVRIFKILLDSAPAPVGQVCYWERPWRDELVWESGWGVLPEFQGQGIAARAVGLLVGKARSERLHRCLHAFPSVANAASNALCRKLGFTCIEECDFEYPPGHITCCNDWRLELW